jgi:hypothetical protein
MAIHKPIDPNDFVAADDVFPDDYDADTIGHAWFTIIPGDSVDAAALVFNENGHPFTPDPDGTKWAISLYGPRYNGQDIPLDDPGAPRHILQTMSRTRDLSEFDWSAVDWAYFE